MAVAAELMSSERANEASVEPKEWCQRVLSTVRQRRDDDRESGHLAMLLTSFIEMQPTSQAFATLLARYAADPRPGIAEAATSLQRAWARAVQVVGVKLETQPAEVYEIVVGPHLIEVEADDGYCHVFTAEEVAALIDEAAARRAPDA